MSNGTRRGLFVWHELMTTDPAAAIRFYTAVIGWGTQAWEGPQPYTMWTADGTPVGGVMQLPPSERMPHWLGYISTPDVDASAAEAQKLNGKVLVPPSDIPDVGRFAVLTDPQGAAFAMFQPGGDQPGPSGPPKPGEFSWHELLTTDPDGAFGFYQSLFGWEKTSAMDMGPDGVYQMFGFGGTPFGGLYKKPAAMPGPPSWQHYIHVGDVKRVADQVKNEGGQVINGPMEVPGGDWIANCVDPQGGMFSIHSAKQ